MKIITHDGQFHTDEIFAIVLLSKFVNHKRFEVIRTRDKVKLEKYKNKDWVWVIDVGGEYNHYMYNFDHHQQSFDTVNQFGNLLSSCGLIFKELTPFLKLKLSDYVYSRLETLVNKIDMQDNGVEYYPEFEFISLYNHAGENGFELALNAATNYLDNLFVKWENEEHNKNLIRDAVQNARDSIISSDVYIPITKEMNATDNKLLVFKRGENQYAIKSLNDGIDVDFSVRCKAPDSWLGLTEDALCEISGFKNMVFCHKNGFLTIVNGSLEDAIKVAKFIISYNEDTNE